MMRLATIVALACGLGVNGDLMADLQTKVGSLTVVERNRILDWVGLIWGRVGRAGVNMESMGCFDQLF